MHPTASTKQAPLLPTYVCVCAPHRVFDEIDEDHDGTISQSEFSTALMLHKSKLAHDVALSRAADHRRVVVLTTATVAALVTGLVIAFNRRK